MYLLVIIALSILWVVVSSIRLGWHPLFALLLAALFVGLATGQGAVASVQLISSGFGAILGQIGLIVLLGVTLGTYLEQSGAIYTIAQRILRSLGPKYPDLAVALIGAVVSIPVFCDSGFIILNRLSVSLGKQSRTKPAVFILCLAMGLYLTHTLLPPTPGPVAATGNLGLSDRVGVVMLMGFLFSIPLVLLAWYVSRRLGRSIVLKDTDGVAPNDDIPSDTAAFTPLLVPLVLITLGAFTNWLPQRPWQVWFVSLGQPVVALGIGVAVAVVLLGARLRGSATELVSRSLKAAGPILAITGAGGAYGAVLKATTLADWISTWFSSGTYATTGLLVAVWAIAAVLKTAQGSSTSAMIIASSLAAPLLAVAGITTPFQLALCVMAIGGGAMMISHTNDSYFWVVSEFSGLSMRDTLRTYSVLTGLLGVSVLILVLLVNWVVA